MKHLIAGALIAVVCVIVIIALIPSEEKRVKKRFRFLSESVSKSSGENALAALQKMKQIANLFDEPCEMKVPDQSLSGRYARPEISAYAGSARSYFSQLDLKFYDLHIVFPEKEIAGVHLTARLTGTSSAGERLDETRELECTLRRIDQQWFFSRIEVIEVLKK